MTNRYTADDFANAKFAELGKYGLRAHKSAGDSYWQRDGIKRATNEEMADAGWVPVPTKPQITETEYSDYVDDLGLGELTLEEILADFGIEVIPDPEPTNTDRLEQLIRESGLTISDNGIEGYAAELAASLNEDGVTAPNVEDN